MWHDHACVGPAVTYSVVVAVALGLSVFAFGLFLAEHAARAVWDLFVDWWNRGGSDRE